jgi:hypothetical protein
MSDRWLRLYTSVVNDPKLQRLPAETFRSVINMWCIAADHDGVLPSEDDIAFILRKPLAKVQALLIDLIRLGLIDDTETGLKPHNWDERQFKSDVSTARVKQFRERQRNARRNGDETLHETPPEQNRTEQREETPSLRSGAKKATRLAADWQPSDADRDFARREGLSDAEIDREAAKYRDFWLAKPGKDGAKADWPATWRNWIRRACESRGIAPASNGADATTDDWERRLRYAREHRRWSRPRWGPMPNEPGCLIPPSLIRPDDGTGWAEWGEANG